MYYCLSFYRGLKCKYNYTSNRGRRESFCQGIIFLSRKKRGRRLDERRLEERNYLSVKEMEREELGKLKYEFLYFFMNFLDNLLLFVLFDCRLLLFVLFLL